MNNKTKLTVGVIAALLVGSVCLFCILPIGFFMVMSAFQAPVDSVFEETVRQVRTPLPTLPASPAQDSSEVEPAEVEPAPVEDLPLPPTDTPPPIDTPVPTPPPDPVVFNGSGDSIENVQMWNGPALLQTTGNDEGRHFAVIPHTVSGEQLLSMVNTTDPYSGQLLLPEPINRLEISAPGAWTIEILPLSSARRLSVPGQIEGSGDEVLVLDGGQPDIATVSGNQAGRHFSVVSYTIEGQQVFGSIVNTTDPYDGQILLEGETGILEVTAVGPWSISVDAQ